MQELNNNDVTRGNDFFDVETRPMDSDIMYLKKLLFRCSLSYRRNNIQMCRAYVHATERQFGEASSTDFADTQLNRPATGLKEPNLCIKYLIQTLS